MIRKTLPSCERIQIAAPKGVKLSLKSIQKVTGERIWEIVERLIESEYALLKKEKKL